jgi:putative endonuclease
MFYTYLLRSVSHPSESYIGSTSDLRSRLSDHNSGKSHYTKKFMPWKLLFYAAFPDRPSAEKFESSFTTRHLTSTRM